MIGQTVSLTAAMLFHYLANKELKNTVGSLKPSKSVIGGIYKIGISNTIISVLSFNYGLKNKQRVKACIKYGILDSVIVAAAITVLFECLAVPLSKLFGMASGEGGEAIQAAVTAAIRISAISYIFMAFSVAVQGVLQAFRYALFPLLVSLLRLCAIVLPIAYLFTLCSDPVNLVWWAFPVAEFVTAAISALILKYAYSKKVRPL